MFSVYYSYIYEDDIEPKVLDKLYVEILQNDTDLSLFDEVYILLNEDGKRLKKLVNSNKYKFMSYKDLLELNRSQIQQMKVIELTHNMVGKDTISINIVLNRDRIPLTIMRYIYNPNKDIWEKSN
jgi:hypothetical protein